MYKIILLIIILCAFLLGCDHYIAEMPENSGFDQNEINSLKNYPIAINNGTPFVQYDKYVFYVSISNPDEDRKNTIYRMDIDGKNKVVLEEDYPGDMIYIYRNKVYYAIGMFDINREIYRMDLDGGNKTKLYEGSFPVFDERRDDIFFTNRRGICKINIDGIEVVEIHKANVADKYYRHDILGMDEDNIYVSISETNSRTTLYSFSKEGFEKTGIHAYENATEHSGAPIIMNFSIIGDSLFYNVGNFQGTANNWLGKLVRIKNDGTLHMVISDYADDKFIIRDDFLYFVELHDPEPIEKKLSIYSGEILPSYHTYDTVDINGWAYTSDFGDDSFLVVSKYIFDTHYENKQEIVRLIRKKDISQFICQIWSIDDWVYFCVCDVDANKTEYGWQGKPIGTDYYRAKQDGTILQHLD